MFRRLLIASTILIPVTAGFGAGANASVFVPSTPGEHYRLAFVTSTSRTGDSSAIADYNSFVTTAAGNDAALPATTWSAIASTPTVNAVDNIACGAACAADPIFLVDGTEVATSTANLFSGALLHAIDVDESGASEDAFYVWTGSSTSGTADDPLGNTSLQYAQYGSGLASDSTWITAGDINDGANNPLYAISGDLVAPGVATVPEPATLGLLAIGALVSAGVRRKARAG